MGYKICCFAGHRDICNSDVLEKEIYNKCEELICNEGVNCFWVGDYGGFDKISANITNDEG